MTDNTTPRICFSYLRFSRAEQKTGDSTKRQTELRDAYVKLHNLVLDSSRMITDEGVSGYNGTNAATGNLSAFLTIVRSGAIPVGSVLLVESLDRLSRDQIDSALGLIREILRCGIELHTLSPERVFTKESLNDPLSLIMILFESSRAYEYSAQLGRRISSAWKSKREEAKANQTPLTIRPPDWLRVVGQITVGNRRVGGRYEVIPERGQVIEQIYQLCADGLGLKLIVKELARRGVPNFNGKPWSEFYIAKILRGQAALGHHTPDRRDPLTKKKLPSERITGLFPPVISEALNAQAKLAMKGRRNKGGRVNFESGKIHPFMGLLKTHSGANVQIKYRQVRRTGPNQLVAFIREADTKNSYPLHAFESLMLGWLVKYEPAPAKKHGGGEISTLEQKLAKLDQRISKLKDSIDSGEDFDSFFELLKSSEKEKKELSQRLEQLRAIEPIGQGLLILQGLVERTSSPDEPDHIPVDRETNLELRAALHRMLKQVDVTIGREGKTWRDKGLKVSVLFRDGQKAAFAHKP